MYTLAAWLGGGGGGACGRGCKVIIMFLNCSYTLKEVRREEWENKVYNIEYNPKIYASSQLYANSGFIGTFYIGVTSFR
jgi:hypothetical protein